MMNKTIRHLLQCAALAIGMISSFAAEGIWRPLWDGKTLDGWHPIGKGDWKIEEGAIHGTHSKGEKEYGHLVTDKTYKNFVVRLKFRTLQGNSGLYFRIEEKGVSGVSGFQAKLIRRTTLADSTKRTGAPGSRSPNPPM